MGYERLDNAIKRLKFGMLPTAPKRYTNQNLFQRHLNLFFKRNHKKKNCLREYSNLQPFILYAPLFPLIHQNKPKFSYSVVYIISKNNLMKKEDIVQARTPVKNRQSTVLLITPLSLIYWIDLKKTF